MALKRPALGRLGYGIIETLIVIIVMGVLVVIVMERYERMAYEARETALRAELLNLRQSIQLYRAMKSRYPKDLRELVTERYAMPFNDSLITRNYLQPESLDERMNILDPFGLPYVYFPLNGNVRSQKEGFEHY